MLPIWFYLVVTALLGLIIGSFLNVVIYRLHTGKSLNNRSHCLSCGKILHWYELFPVISYLVLRGRCSNCQSFIPLRYVLVEALTAGVFVLAYLKTGDITEFIVLSAILSVLIVGLVYDLYHMIIPDEVVLVATVLAGTLISWQAYFAMSFLPILLALSGAVIAFLVYASLWFLSLGRAFGFGDAKLAIPLGILVGLSGVFSMIVLSFWIGAVIALFLMGLQKILHSRHRVIGLPYVKMKSEIPFAPFLVVAFTVVYFGEVQVLDLIKYVFYSF